MINEAKLFQFDTVKAEVERFLNSYPVTFIGTRMENWQLDKAPEHRQALSDAIVKADSLWKRLRLIPDIHIGYGPLSNRLLEARNNLRHEFEKYEMYGLGRKGELRETRPIKPVVSPRPAWRIPKHLKQGVIKEEVKGPEKQLKCPGCGAALRLMGLPPEEPTIKLQYPIQCCPLCGTQIGRGKDIQVK